MGIHQLQELKIVGPTSTVQTCTTKIVNIKQIGKLKIRIYINGSGNDFMENIYHHGFFLILENLGKK
jgi:hypothetical protein